MNETQKGTVVWAGSVGIFEKSNPLKQHGKMQSEVTEYRDELVILNELSKLNRPEHELAEGLERAKMELGDIYVTADVQAAFLGTTPEECQRMALEKNMARTGKMKNGLYEKD